VHADGGVIELRDADLRCCAVEEHGERLGTQAEVKVRDLGLE